MPNEKQPETKQGQQKRTYVPKSVGYRPQGEGSATNLRMRLHKNAVFPIKNDKGEVKAYNLNIQKAQDLDDGHEPQSDSRFALDVYDEEAARKSFYREGVGSTTYATKKQFEENIKGAIENHPEAAEAQKDSDYYTFNANLKINRKGQWEPDFRTVEPSTVAFNMEKHQERSAQARQERAKEREELQARQQEQAQTKEQDGPEA